MANFETEREGQLEFYNTFLPLIDPSLTIDDILADDNDGVLNGNLLEFKLRINDLNSTLFQTIKYLSALRIKGKPIPANILLVDLNAEQAYLYRSNDYLSYIENVYNGGASKGTSGFAGNNYLNKYDYSSQLGSANLINALREKEYTKIHLDENCIVGWATVFYKIKPEARKEDFIGDNTGVHKTLGEIRNPLVFKDYIYPYTEENNVKFQYLMDKLNDTLQKKNLGAFYTPPLYAMTSHELLYQAIQRVPKGNDYIIIDRCAGTGNLEIGLSDEILSHCILSTIEYYEYKVLQALLGSKVKHLIPPKEYADTFNAGLVRGSDALSEEFIKNSVIHQYIDNPKCTVILFENPPYTEVSIEHRKKKGDNKKALWKKNFAVQEMKKEVKGTTSNDLGSVFIWSGFKFYLRQPTDSFIVFSPVKYWKVNHLVNKKFIDGFAFNRKHFHTSISACIMVALWSNEDNESELLELTAYDIEDNNVVKYPQKLPIKKIHSLYSNVYFDKRSFPNDEENGIAVGLDGIEKQTSSAKKKFNDNIIGYMCVAGTNFDNPDLQSSLLIATRYEEHGFYLRKDNFLEKLPLFCASRYITYNREWTERSRIMKSGDGSVKFFEDIKNGKLDQWLRKCLLFSCLEMQNHMRTFSGSDGRFYRNEICLDTSHGDTFASIELKHLDMTLKEQTLYNEWCKLLNYAKATNEYNSELTYGVFQIFAEIDTSYKENEDTIIWNNLEVHSSLRTLKELVKDYYNTEIKETLFKYELLK